LRFPKLAAARASRTVLSTFGHGDECKVEPANSRNRFPKLWSGSIWLVSVMFLFAVSASAATHPVPLEKNTPDSKCIECHECDAIQSSG
jgi:hypothetical protein